LGHFPFPVLSSRPSPLQTAAHQTYPKPCYLSPAESLGPRVGQPLTPILAFLSPTSDSHRTGRPRRGRAHGMGRSPRPAGPHAEGPVCAHEHESNPAPGRECPFCPRGVCPCIVAGAEEAGPPRPPGRSKPGQIGVFAPTFAAPGFKGKARLRPERPSHQPPLGFSLSSLVSAP
jgi:hypothetical protein